MSTKACYSEKEKLILSTVSIRYKQKSLTTYHWDEADSVGTVSYIPTPPRNVPIVCFSIESPGIINKNQVLGYSSFLACRGLTVFEKGIEYASKRLPVSSCWKMTAGALYFFNHLEISPQKQIKQQEQWKQSLTESPVKGKPTPAGSRGS